MGKLRRCRVCKEDFPIARFYLNGSGKPEGMCKQCRNTRKEEVRRQHKIKFIKLLNKRRAGGGAGGEGPPASSKCGGAGGGGSSPAGNGTANTGGGGAGFGRPTGTGGSGGSGVVILRYKYQ